MNGMHAGMHMRKIVETITKDTSTIMALPT